MNSKRLAASVILFWVIFFTFQGEANGEGAPKGVDAKYKKHFRHYVDRRSLKETVLNLVGLTDYDMGRSFALIAGVSRYQIPGPSGDLNEAHVDVEQLVAYLRDQEGFDEIVVLENQDVNYDTLTYFLRAYFPSKTAAFPRSRFLFCYSGHGMQGGPHKKDGLLLMTDATSLEDSTHAIALETVRTFLQPVIDSTYHTLILINSCYSGSFATHTFGGGAIPQKPGAHAITAGGTAEVTRADSRVGPGSLFFETVISGLATGNADLLPKEGGDGVVTAEELFTFVKQQIQYFTNSSQNPTFTNFALTENTGGSFFFFNSKKFAAAKERPEWKQSAFKGFGSARKQQLANANELYAKENFIEALKIYSEAADEGDADAIKRAAFMYAYGKGVKQDMLKARTMLETLAKNGDAEAMFEFGKTYNYFDAGKHGRENQEIALRWFRKAADAGSTAAMCKVAAAYYVGRVVALDMISALSWYNKAAEAGNSDAMRSLGAIYISGAKGIASDSDEGLRWLRKSAAAGNGEAIRTLAEIYEQGRTGIPRDYAESMRWLTAALGQGTNLERGETMREIGRLYEEGKGAPKNYEQAIKWYEKAIALGDYGAMARYGRCYKYGRGVDRNYAEALRLFKTIIANEEKDFWRVTGEPLYIASFELGDMYERGLGMSKDLQRAIDLFKSCDGGYEPAANALRRLGIETFKAEAGWGE